VGHLLANRKNTCKSRPWHISFIDWPEIRFQVLHFAVLAVLFASAWQEDVLFSGSQPYSSYRSLVPVQKWARCRRAVKSVRKRWVLEMGPWPKKKRKNPCFPTSIWTSAPKKLYCRCEIRLKWSLYLNSRWLFKNFSRCHHYPKSQTHCLRFPP